MSLHREGGGGRRRPGAARVYALLRLRADVEDALDGGDRRANRDEREGALDEQDSQGHRGAAGARGTAARVDRRADDGTGDQAGAQDHQSDFAWHEAHGRHPRAGGEPEAFRLGARVADHEGRGHRPDREDRGICPAAREQAAGDADVRDRLAGAVERRVEERAERGDLPGRPRERPVEEVEDPEDEHEDPGRQPGLLRGRIGSDARSEKANERESVRGKAEAAKRHRDGGRGAADSLAKGGGDDRAGHEAASSTGVAPSSGRGSAGPARPRTRRW
jgi:hypothetical protein